MSLVNAANGEARVTVFIQSTDKTKKEPFSDIFEFGSRSGSKASRAIEITLSDGVISALADFLGPIEGAAE